MRGIRNSKWFATLRKRIAARSITGSRDKIFGHIYQQNLWLGESRSGIGSDLVQTAVVQRELPRIVEYLSASTLLDIPCGDFFWMRNVEIPAQYIGADIVEELVAANNAMWANSGRKFVKLDLCLDPLPKVDLIFSRDVLVHLSFKDIRLAVANMKDSGSEWLLTTTFPGRGGNVDIATGDWRPLDLQAEPFNFPKPTLILNEECTQASGAYSDKSLGLWRLADLTPGVTRRR